MKRSGLRTHIQKNKEEFVIISIVLFVTSILYSITVTRDRFIISLLQRFPSETLVQVAYFDKRSDPALYFSIGNYYFSSGPNYDIVSAQKYFKKTLALDPQFPWANYQLSRTFFINGDQRQALEYINKELEYHPDNKRSHYIKGLIYGYTGKLDEAVAEFKHFLMWKPDSWAGHNDLAWIYFQKGDFNNALATATAGLQYSPGNPWLLNTVGVSQKNLGNTDSALTAFTQAQKSMDNISATTWGMAYPGNDPDFYVTGVQNMRATIESNIQLINNTH